MLLLLYGSCAKSNNEQVLTNSETESIFELDTSRHVILKYDPAWHWILKGGTATELNDEELAVIEVVLQDLIEEVNRAQLLPLDSLMATNPNYYLDSPRMLSLKDKYRQYVPVLNEAGEKEVWINLFCVADEGWKDGSVKVSDGGSCFFNVVVNVDQKSHRDLNINPDA